MTDIITNRSEWEAFWGSIENDWREVNKEPLLSGILSDLETLHANYFGAEVGPDGVAWPELAASTIAKKGHNQILVDTNRLKSSLIGQTSDSIRETFQEGDNSGLRYGTEVEYSQYHNEATDNRAHVGINEKDLDAIAERSVDYMLEGITDV